MKRSLAFMLAMMFALTAFGVTAVFGGFIGASALYDYYIYTKLPGFSVYTDAELAEMDNFTTEPGRNETIDGIGNVVTWKYNKGDEWGNLTIYPFHARNMKKESNTQHDDFKSPTWAAQDTVGGGKTFVGDQSFAGQDGIAFWVGRNGQPFDGNVTITLIQLPCKGPYFNGTLDDDIGDHTADELNEAGTGFRYASRTYKPDENGYVHYDFKTDFYQSDWWSRDDEGNPQQGDLYNGGIRNYHPVPESKRAAISGLIISFGGMSIGDDVSIGDVMMWRDSRVHLDELEELMMQFDALDPEAYTESSYEAVTEVYLEAYNVMTDPDVGENYSQNDINQLRNRLKSAMDALQPMFKTKSETVVINGFDSLTEDDVDEINDGGASLDAAMLTDEVMPPDNTVQQTIYVIGGAFDGDPSYGWSKFTTSVLNDDDEIEAVGNVFGADNLDESAGLRFWIKYGETYDPAPTDMIVGVGSSASGVYFECDPENAALPEEEGYVGVAWNTFYDVDGDEEIFDYLGEIDYITIQIEGCYQKEFYISDLHAFEWSIHSCVFTVMDNTIIDAQNYMATLNRNDWSVRSWQRLEEAVEAARALHDTYAVTQQDVDAAAEYIRFCIRRLTPIGNTPTKDELDALEAAYAAAQAYWHGNYTGRSYADMKAVMDDIGKYIDDEMSSESCREFTAMMNEAIAGLVPITHGGIIDTIRSSEDLSSREFSRMNGQRRPNVLYELVTASTSVTLPAKAVKMTAQADLYSKTTDEHGALQFKLFDSFGNSLVADVQDETGNTIGGAIGDLSGSSGIRLWVGVNDVTLAKNACFRFGVSNITEGPLFERHVVEIPFPASGSGWIYLPWEFFEFYDEWTKGVEINLAEIRFWIIRVDGEVPQGLEVYVACIDAYTDPGNTVNATPVITGVADGETVDVSAGALLPKWDVGTATLKVGNDEMYYVAGTPITTNEDYVLTVTNGDKKTSVSFTVTGGAAAYQTPVVSGVADGAAYDSDVTITWDVGDATLNGEPFEKGGVVSEDGNYVLEVINGTKSVSVRFSVSKKPAYKKGDADGDGKITVADALAALRVAARLAPPTDELIAICDTDHDGAITVADALAILRVAARLADENSLA